MEEGRLTNRSNGLYSGVAMRHKPLLYLETSVFGFYFDTEPRNAVRREAVVT